MTSDQETAWRRYDEIRAVAVEDLFGGRWEEAVRGFERAAGVARETGDADLAGLAVANLALAAVEGGRPPPVPALLREALGRSRAPASRFFCAWALSKLYLHSHDLGKAAFYGRVALQVAPPRYLGSAEQSLGVTLLARGQYREARDYIERALLNWPTEKAPLALCLSTLAYLWSLAGDRREAGRAIEETLSHCRDLDAFLTWYQRDVHLSLGFSRREMGNPGRALHHAERVLALVDEGGPEKRHEHKMALYLAAEAAFDSGVVDAGMHYADELQRSYYPGQKDLRTLIRTFRTSGLVNWLA